MAGIAGALAELGLGGRAVRLPVHARRPQGARSGAGARSRRGGSRGPRSPSAFRPPAGRRGQVARRADRVDGRGRGDARRRRSSSSAIPLHPPGRPEKLRRGAPRAGRRPDALPPGIARPVRTARPPGRDRRAARRARPARRGRGRRPLVPRARRPARRRGDRCRPRSRRSPDSWPRWSARRRDGGPDFHRGLAALLFQVVNRDDAPEVGYYRDIIERSGQPALDAGCGPGRLLCQYLRAGLDVDGCDISPDMLELCRARAEADGRHAVASPPVAPPSSTCRAATGRSSRAGRSA